MDQEYLRKLIIQTIYEKSDVEVTDYNINLLSNTYAISVVELLYIIESLETQLQLPLFRLFEENDYVIFTVTNLSQHIIQLINSEQLVM